MSNGVTEILLRVAADATGLQALAVQFEAAEKRIVAAAQRAQSAMKGSGAGGGTADLARMKSEIDQISGATRTLAAETEALTKKVEEGGKRRVRASKEAKDATKSEAEEAQAYARTESRVTEMILAEKVKLASVMKGLVQQRVAENFKAAQASTEAEVRAAQAATAATQKQTATMTSLRWQAQTDAFKAAQKQAAEEERAAARAQLAWQKANRTPSAARGVTAAEDAATQSQVTQMILAAEAAKRLAAQKAALRGGSEQGAAAAKHEADMYYQLNGAARGLSGGLGLLWTTYGAFLPLIAGFAASAGIKKSIELGSEFGYQLKFVGVIAQATAAQVDGLNYVFQRAAETSLFGSTEVAKGARVLVQAGFSAQEAMEVLPKLLKFATLGEIELAQGAEIASGQMHAFGLEVKDIPHILDSTAKAAQISQTNISEMGQALRQSSSVAQQYNISIDEMNALLSVLADRNIRGSAAGTALRNMLQELDPHTQSGKRAFEALGIAVYDAGGKMKSIVPLMMEFSAKFAKFDKQSQNQLSADLFNQRGEKAALTAMASANTLMASGNTLLEERLQLVKNSDGTLDANAAKINDTFKVQGVEAVHTFHNALIQMFQGIEPELTKMVKGLKEFAAGDDLKQGLKDLGTVFLMLANVLGTILATLAALDKYTLGFLRDSQREGGGTLLGTGSADIADWFRPSATANVTPEQIAAQRAAREARENAARIQAQIAAEVSDARAEMRRMEAANLGAGGSQGYGNYAKGAEDKLKYDREAQQRAWDEVTNENKIYAARVAQAKSHYTTQIDEARAYHDARLTSDKTFFDTESQLSSKEFKVEQDSLTAHVAFLKSKLGTVAKDKKNDVQTMLQTAQSQLEQRTAAYTLQLTKDQTREAKKYNDEGFTTVEMLHKKNDETRSEIQAMKDLNPLEKDASIQQADAKLAYLEVAKAKYQATKNTLEYYDALSVEEQIQLKVATAEIKTLDEFIAKIKEARAERLGLLKEKQDVSNEWTVAAVKALNDYTKAGVSSAKIIGDAFKTAFGALEHMLFNWVKTGKLNFKEFITSIGDDLLKMLIKLNITQPLAQLFSGLLQGSGGKGILGLLGGLFGVSGGGGMQGPNPDGSVVSPNWGGMLNSAGSLGQFGYGMWTGAGTGMAGGAGAWTGNVLFGSSVSTAAGGMGPPTSGLLGQGGMSANSGMLATVGWIAAIVAAMYANNEMFTAGWRRPNDSSSRNPLTAVQQGGPLMGASYSADAIFRSLGFSDRMASLFSGSSMNTRLFGHRMEQADAFGIRGNVTGSGVTGENWQDFSQRGGVFTSDIRRTAPSPLDTSQTRAFADMMAPITNVVTWLGMQLGVDSHTALAGYSKPFNLQMNENGKPLTNDEANKLFNELFTGVMKDQVELMLRAGNKGVLADYLRDVKGTTEELGTAVKTVLDLMDAMKSLKDMIAEIEGGPIGALNNELGKMKKRVDDAEAAFSASLSSKDPGKMLAAEQELTAAIIDRYQKEISMVQQLVQQIRQIEESAYQFSVNIAGRINAVGGSRDVGAIAMNRAGVLRRRVGGNAPPGQQLDDVNGYVGAIDTWYNARRSQIERDAQAQASQQQAYFDAQKRNAEVRLANVQAELDIANQFKSVLDRSKQMMNDMKLSSDNPLSAIGRLGMAGDEVTRLRDIWKGATGTARIDAANKLLDALQTYRAMGQDTLQRPSDEWQAVYNSIMVDLTAVQADAKTQGDRAIELQQQLILAQAEANMWNSMTASASQASSAALDALNEEALGYYTWAEEQGASLFEAQREQAQAQLMAVTGGMEANLFIAARAKDTVDLLKSIDARLAVSTSTTGTPSPVVGNPLDRVPGSGVVVVHLPTGADENDVVNAIVRNAPRIKRAIAQA